MGKLPIDPEFKGSNLPVDNAEFEDAVNFMNKLNKLDDGYNYRLPSEADRRRVFDNALPRFGGCLRATHFPMLFDWLSSTAGCSDGALWFCRVSSVQSGRQDARQQPRQDHPIVRCGPGEAGS